jgi:vacuolar-type H+-ATPase subunit F/Vma7
MRALVMGGREDVTGFALAGVAGRVCANAAETEHAIDEAGDVLLIFSASTAAHVAARLAQWSRNGSGPLFVVLPRS